MEAANLILHYGPDYRKRSSNNAMLPKLLPVISQIFSKPKTGESVGITQVITICVGIYPNITRNYSYYPDITYRLLPAYYHNNCYCTSSYLPIQVTTLNAPLITLQV